MNEDRLTLVFDCIVNLLVNSGAPLTLPSFKDVIE
jgi:hypothetical protein